MMTPLVVAVITALLGLAGLREDSPSARPPAVVWRDLRAAGWRRVTWAAARAVAGVAVIASACAARYAAYTVLIAAAGLCSYAATLLSLDGRPVRVRLEVAR